MLLLSSALKADGTVWTWGQNNYGQLGINVGDTTANNANGKRVYAGFLFFHFLIV